MTLATQAVIGKDCRLIHDFEYSPDNIGTDQQEYWWGGGDMMWTLLISQKI